MLLLRTGPAICGYGTGVGESVVRTVAGGLHGFPAALTSFVGRAAAVSEVAGLVGQSRLVTVTGPGGVGKTRLADEVARHVAGRFADGVWLVELAAVRDPALVPAVVAAALEVREQPGVPVAEALARVLSRQQMLVVLDNCEHVIAAAAGLCAGLLAAADDVRILATSRERLQVAGEACYRLASLALPGPHDADGATDGEAAALFVDRARQADARFVLDGENGPLVARLVARLDGMPLAIELAAARAEALGVAQLLDRIDDRFALLVAGDRLAPSRHRSLAATVEWSYRLLDEQQRRVFRQLSVFPGPFTLEGAEAVAGEDAAPAVARLVDCSLLSPPRAGPDGRARHVMLETLRAYGAGLLAEAGEQEGAVAALTGYALRVARQAAAGLATSSGELAAARWLDAEDATMRQVLAWASEHDPKAGLRIAVALGNWRALRGRQAEGYPLLLQAAGHAEVGSERWCAAQVWLGWTALGTADPSAAMGHFTAVRDAFTDRPPSRALADALMARSAVLRHLGQNPEAAAEARQALALARELKYPGAEAWALGNLGLIALNDGDMDNAVQLARQAVQLSAERSGVQARFCSFVLTQALVAADDLTGARRIGAAALAQAREVNDPWNLLGLLQQMATLELQAGRAAAAAAHLNEAIQIGLRADDLRRDLSTALDRSGHLCAQTGRHAEALTMWAAFAAVLRHAGIADELADARSRHEPLRRARQTLGTAQARAAEERGAAMSLDTAAEYALMLTAPSAQAPGAAAGAGNLSTRERELVTLVAQGHTNAQIAAQLHISIRTVSSHLDRIRDKTGCRRRADLTRLALSTGLI
jgi:predicted ATPase/DNA-binding CsgD family transcriptional regulator